MMIAMNEETQQRVKSSVIGIIGYIILYFMYPFLNLSYSSLLVFFFFFTFFILINVLLIITFYFLNNKLNVAINYIILVNILILVVQWFISQITSNFSVFSRNLLLSFLNGLAFSMVLFLMVSGFYLVFGLADVINFAHGAFFMLGGFVGFESYLYWENFFVQANLFKTNEFLYSILSFILAIILTSVIMGAIGGIIEISTIRRLYKQPLNQILLTVGISFIIIQIANVIWGQSQYKIPNHTQTKYFFLTGSIREINIFGFTLFDFGSISFEAYSVVIIVFGISLAVLMYLVFKRTKIGLIVQAAIEDSEMAELLGINVKLILTLVFITGTILAGIAGFLLVPSIHGGAYTGLATTYLLYAFVIVVVGGAHYGKLEGTFYGSLIIGFSYKFTEIFFTDYTSVIVFLIMVLVLVFKPTGLTGQK